MDTDPDRNKQVVREYVDAFNRGDLGRLRSLFSDDAEIQGVLGRGQIDRILPIWEQLITGYGMQLEIEEMVAEDDRVAVRYTERGTFAAAAFGREPTGRSYELVAMEWFVLSNGRIRRRWGARDAASQARQLGIPLD
ncbi:MAG: ester cyclase [Acidobacteria bacterium]|nr:MAG: ester cyclase [Acidobacteriota bacterium]REK08792.1 MAG: ester cyclase [Acidobacteriota bacterium]